MSASSCPNTYACQYSSTGTCGYTYDTVYTHMPPYFLRPEPSCLANNARPLASHGQAVFAMAHFQSLNFRPKFSSHQCLGMHDLPCRPHYSLAWGISCAAVRSGRVEAVDSPVRLRPSGSPSFCQPALSFRFQTGAGLETEPPPEGILISFAGCSQASRVCRCSSLSKHAAQGQTSGLW